MKNYPKVSIIFANFNGGREPLECLTSIRNLNYPKNKLQTIVVDNGSTDSSDKTIEKTYKEVTLIKNKSNLGFAKAINQGVEKSKGSYIFIGNDDLVFEKNSLAKMISYIESNSKVGVVGGKIFLKRRPKEICSAGQKINKWTGHVSICPYPNSLKEPDWIQGCALLISKMLFKKIGLLDPSFTYGFDDYDLCLRVKMAGFKIIYFPQAVFWHGEGTTANKNRALKHYQWYQSKLLFVIKNMPALNIFPILIFQTLAIPYKAVMLQDYRFFPYLKAFLWNLKHLPKTLKQRRMSRIYKVWQLT